MRKVKIIFLVCVGFFAWAVIGGSDTLMTSQHPISGINFVYSAFLILSVAYLHWGLRAFLISLRGLTKHQVQEVRVAVVTRYENGFFTGTIGLGYILLGLHVFAIFMRHEVRESPFDLLRASIFFIVLGILSQTRCVVQYLSERFPAERTEPNLQVESPG
jgi:hypothetical protein